MGRRGTKPIPTALKLARGNPGKRALNRDEPQIPVSDLTPPAGLKGRALQEWQQLGPTLIASGVLTIADRKCFEIYCQIVADEARYERLVAKMGDEAAQRLGYSGHLLKIRGQLKQYLAELGGTPSSRSGVKARKPADDGNDRRRRFFGIHHDPASTA